MRLSEDLVLQRVEHELVLLEESTGVEIAWPIATMDEWAKLLERIDGWMREAGNGIGYATVQGKQGRKSLTISMTTSDFAHFVFAVGHFHGVPWA